MSDFSYEATSGAVHASLDSALASIPAGKRGALLVRYVAQPDGSRVASAMVAAHLGSSWEVAAGSGWDGDRKHRPGVAFELAGSW